MVERYFRVYVQRERLYTEGAPLIIEAVAVLKDNVTGQKVGQVKFRRISSEAILSVKARVQALDGADREIGKPVEHDYLNLSAQRDDLFGQKEAVPLSEPSALGIKVEVVEVIFHNKTVWNGEGKTWSPLPKLPSITSVFQDQELVKQYERELGSSNAYFTVNNLFTREKDLWFCACGELNRADDTKCFKCKRERQIQENMDFDLLKKHKEERLAEEQKAREEEEARKEAERKKLEAERREQEAKRAAEEEQRRIEEAKRRKKAKRRKLILGTICVVIIAGAVVTVKVIIPSQKYKEAQALFEAGEYQEAKNMFQSLDGYSDSERKMREADDAYEEEQREAQAKAEYEAKEKKYEAALKLMEEKEYEKAKLEFNELGEFSDSQQKSEECTALILEEEKRKEEEEKQKKYESASASYEQKEYLQAAEEFAEIEDYKDCEEKVKECHYRRALELIDQKAYSGILSELEKADGYEDSKELIDTYTPICEINEKFIGIKEGEQVQFGRFVEDDNGNEPEEVYWDVVSIEDNRAMLIAALGLEFKKYNKGDNEATWENCSLRKWLNEKFYATAFSDVEKQFIVPTEIETPVRGDIVEAGILSPIDTFKTEDKVFLPSYSELKVYKQYMNGNIVSEYVYNKAGLTEEKSTDKYFWARDTLAGTETSKKGALGWLGKVLGNALQLETVPETKAGFVRPAIWVEFDDSVVTGD